MTRGRFITLEGGEGAGKSTQTRMLCAALEAQGIACVLTREPGGTPGAEEIRRLLLDPVHDWTPEAEALLFAAARADHVARLIAPALAAGKWVVCDRFVDSTRAYQGGGGAMADADILRLHAIGSHGLLPDLTLLVDITPAAAAERIAERDGGASDRIGGKPAAYHAAVGSAFRALAEGEPDRFALVDGDGPPQAVHSEILRFVGERLGLP